MKKCKIRDEEAVYDKTEPSVVVAVVAVVITFDVVVVVDTFVVGVVIVPEEEEEDVDEGVDEEVGPLDNVVDRPTY